MEIKQKKKKEKKVKRIVENKVENVENDGSDYGYGLSDEEVEAKKEKGAEEEVWQVVTKDHKKRDVKK